MIAIVKQSASLRRFLAEHPLCCYCGATAATRDHVPSTQMFDGRHRPKGLEVPACDACNQATKKHEQIVALIARLSGPSVTREQQREFKDLLRRISKHSPMLHAELTPSWRQQYDVQNELGGRSGDGGPINASGPRLRESTDAFSMKLAHALYYTRAGRIIPPAGGVAHRLYTNWDRRKKLIPPTIFEGLSEPQTLRQGEFNVSNQFEYAFGIGDRFGAFVATFRQTFLVQMIVHEDRQALQQLGPDIPITLPGVR